ncbi:MAG: type II secretion system F family protein [Dehalococcoidia bacterium]|nr:type II secretion system F family protein [Dehalococcoidia bacterium]
MVALIPLLAFVTVALLIWALTAPGKESMEGRLRKHGYLPTSLQVVDLDKPFSQRVASPLISKAGDMVVRIAPERMQRRTKEKLEQAHLKINPTNFLLFMTILALGLPLIFIGPAIREGHLGFREFILGLGFFFLGVRMPDFWLSRKITARQEKIRKSLPDALDMITICVEAGYGLDAALAKVSEKTQGPLADELKHTLSEVNLGKPRSQALRDMARRTNVSDLQSFIATIIQAEQMGVSIGSILRVQSDSMRVKRRQRAEEAAMKAPVKMLFPLVLFILPAMFVVILGPAALRMLSFFTGQGG